MWTPIAFTMCLLMPGGDVECKEDDDWPDPPTFETEVECKAALLVSGRRYWIDGKPYPVVSMMAECKEHEGDPA